MEKPIRSCQSCGDWKTTFLAGIHDGEIRQVTSILIPQTTTT